MELRDIEYFAAVAEHRHLGRAAEALGLSQSALSKSLRRLEEEMRAKLVRRTPKGVELTPEGSTLLSRVHRVRVSLDDIAREVADVSLGLAGQLRIAAGTGHAFHLLPAVCTALAKSAPHAILKIREMGYGDAIAALRKGELDLAIQTTYEFPPPDLAQQRLYDDRYVVIAAAGHRLAAMKRVTLADLAKERWILPDRTFAMGRHVLEVFEKHGLPPPCIMVETGSPTLRLPVVAGSDLLGYSWGSIVRQARPQLRLVELDVPELASAFTASVIYRNDAYLSPVAKRLMEALKSAARNMTGETEGNGTRPSAA